MYRGWISSGINDDTEYFDIWAQQRPRMRPKNMFWTLQRHLQLKILLVIRLSVVVAGLSHAFFSTLLMLCIRRHQSWRTGRGLSCNDTFIIMTVTSLISRAWTDSKSPPVSMGTYVLHLYSCIWEKAGLPTVELHLVSVWINILQCRPRCGMLSASGHPSPSCGVAAQLIWNQRLYATKKPWFSTKQFGHCDTSKVPKLWTPVISFPPATWEFRIPQFSSTCWPSKFD